MTCTWSPRIKCTWSTRIVHQEYKDNVYLEYNDEEKNPAGDINLVSG